MLASFKDVILPYAIWALVMGCVLVGFFKDARVALFLLAFLVSLPNLRYPTHAIPLGSQTLDLLVAASLFGRRPKEILGSLAEQIAQKKWLLGAIFVYTYLATWNTSLRYDLPPPISTANTVLASWKNYVLMMLTYFAAYRNLHSEKDARTLTAVMLCVVLLIVLQNYRSVLAGENYSYAKRAAGPFGYAELNANHFGAFLAHYGPMALTFSLFALPKWQRIAGAGTFLLSIHPLFYSYSRGAWAATVIGLMIIGLCKKRSIILGVIVLAMSWQTLLPTDVVDRIQMTETEDGELEESAALRLVVWDKAEALFKENPVFGIGLEGFVFETEGFRLHNTHNYYLQLAAEQGLIGLTLFMLLLLRAAWSGWRLYRDGRSEFLRGLGLGFLACTAAVAVTNVFGDRFSQLAMGTFYFLFLGTVDRCLRMSHAESAAELNAIQNTVRAPHVLNTT